jgi:hypothetical protein
MSTLATYYNMLFFVDAMLALQPTAVAYYTPLKLGYKHIP